MTLIYERIPYFCGVYAIRNRNTGAMYIGCSKDLQWRWRNHMAALRLGKHDQPLLQAAWNADGPRAFELVLLEWSEFSDGRTLREAERRWLIDLEAKGTTLYNKTLPRYSIPVVDETQARPSKLTAEAS